LKPKTNIATELIILNYPSLEIYFGDHRSDYQNPDCLKNYLLAPQQAKKDYALTYNCRGNSGLSMHAKKSIHFHGSFQKSREKPVFEFFLRKPQVFFLFLSKFIQKTTGCLDFCRQ
jgi:hypothetical protein